MLHSTTLVSVKQVIELTCIPGCRTLRTMIINWATTNTENNSNIDIRLMQLYYKLHRVINFCLNCYVRNHLKQYHHDIFPTCTFHILFQLLCHPQLCQVSKQYQNKLVHLCDYLDQRLLVPASHK